MQNVTRFLFAILLFGSTSLHAQEDLTGNWLMYFGTNKVSDNFSIHTEAQYRNHTIEPVNIEQLLLRTGLNYHFNPEAALTLGYGYVTSHDYDSTLEGPASTEHRIFQQLILQNRIGRIKFEHRYRIEQRWVSGNYLNRLRYRLMAIAPLNTTSIIKGTWFLTFYDEIFMNTEQVFFDRNRLYGAVGYQATQNMQLQAGYLRQRVNPFDKGYLQFAVIYNTDLRSRHE